MSCWEVKIQGQLHTMDVLSMESAKPLQPSPGSFFFFFFFRHCNKFWWCAISCGKLIIWPSAQRNWLPAVIDVSVLTRKLVD